MRSVPALAPAAPQLSPSRVWRSFGWRSVLSLVAFQLLGPGACVEFECSTDAECGAGERCVAGACAAASSRCGNGEVEAGEECDPGPEPLDDSCTASCTRPFCGDGLTRPSAEQCDDGGLLNGTPGYCSLDCTRATCGDGLPTGSESCDHGERNLDPLDECDAICSWKPCGETASSSTAAPR